MTGIENNPSQGRFELAIEGSHAIAAAYYRIERDRIVLTHTIVPERFSRQGMASRLAREVFDEIRASGRKAVLFYAHLDISPGATAELPQGYKERALYVATGSVEMDGVRYEAGRMLVFDAGASRVRALESSTVMVLGGEPVGERFIHWNFVSSSKDRLAQAAADWKAGRMKLPDADDTEFIPLPDEPAPPAPAMS
jgi:redox-sensitive bicupin YhaK (pirin superfamily)